MLHSFPHRAVPVAHADVTLYVERRRAGESEGLHEGVDLRLVQPVAAPRALEVADQLVVDGASGGWGRVGWE